MTLDEAIAIRDALKADVTAIQLQLGCQDRHNDDGLRMTDHEYWAWKQKAKVAMRYKLERLREAKQLVRSMSDRPHNDRMALILRALAFLLEEQEPSRGWRREMAVRTDEASALLNDIRDELDDSPDVSPPTP